MTGNSMKKCGKRQTNNSTNEKAKKNQFVVDLENKVYNVSYKYKILGLAINIYKITDFEARMN